MFRQTENLIEPLKKAKPNPITHIAIVMDGNGRWAKKKSLPKIAGHKQGAETAKKIIESCIRKNIKYLTLYAFSSENWSRPKDEVNELMNLLRLYLTNELNNLHKKGIRINIIGDKSKLAIDIQKLIEQSEYLTRYNENLILSIALNYGGRNEIINAAKEIAKNIISKKLDLDFTEEDFSKFLYTKNIPDPDLLIRTSGEQRVSNFLLWQLAYTELYFCNKLWPDFCENDLDDALKDYIKRDRRFGK